MIKTKNIHQTAHFKVSPEVVYDAIMDWRKHGEFTDSKAKIDPKVGGKFTIFDGWATGQTLELVKNKKIVQSWHASDWPEGHMSKVTFDLMKEPDGVKLEFTHENVPIDFASDIEQGWKDYYWKAMQEYFKKGKALSGKGKV